YCAAAPELLQRLRQALSDPMSTLPVDEAEDDDEANQTLMSLGRVRFPGPGETMQRRPTAPPGDSGQTSAAPTVVQPVQRVVSQNAPTLPGAASAAERNSARPAPVRKPRYPEVAGYEVIEELG